MILSDLIWNADVDINCNYIIRNADTLDIIHSTRADGHHKLSDATLDRRVTYITISSDRTLVIEIE